MKLNKNELLKLSDKTVKTNFATLRGTNMSECRSWDIVEVNLAC